MKRFIVSVALLFVASTSEAQRSPIVCEGHGARVTYDGKTASYAQNGAFVATSRCAGTRMAVFNMICQESPSFRFFFASASEPARLDANGTSMRLACH